MKAQGDKGKFEKARKKVLGKVDEEAAAKVVVAASGGGQTGKGPQSPGSDTQGGKAPGPTAKE